MYDPVYDDFFLKITTKDPLCLGVCIGGLPDDKRPCYDCAENIPSSHGNTIHRFVSYYVPDKLHDTLGWEIYICESCARTRYAQNTHASKQMEKELEQRHTLAPTTDA